MTKGFLLPDERRTQHRFFRFALLATAVYAIVLAIHFSSEPGGSDSSGYLNSAKLLTQGRLSTELRTVPELAGGSPYDFQPLGFVASETSTRLAPTYPIGLPLHLAVAGAVLGWHAGTYVTIIGGALAALAAFYAVAREVGVSRQFAAVAVASLALCRVFLFGAVQPLSDTLNTMWCVLAVLAALRARGGSLAWSAACGLAFAVAVLVRPSSVVLLPALVILLGHWRKLTVTALAGAPFAVLLGAYQNYLYGSPTRSGYGPIFGIFGPEYVGPSLANFSLWLAVLLPLSCLALPALFILPWRRMRRELAALTAWAAAFIAFYAFYQVSSEDWSCLRFILPAFPPLLILASLGLEAALARVSDARRARLRRNATIAVLTAGFGVNLWLGIPNARRHEGKFAKAEVWAKENLPSDAIVVSMFFSGTLYFHTDLPVLRWDSVSAEAGKKYLAALQRSGRPVFAIVDAFELNDREKRMDRVVGKWEKLADFGSASAWRILPAATAP